MTEEAKLGRDHMIRKDETEAGDTGPVPASASASAVAINMARLREIAREARALWAEIGDADKRARKAFPRMIERTQWRREAGIADLSDKELHAARAISGRLAEVEGAAGLSPYAATPIAAYNAIKSSAKGERPDKGEAMPANLVSVTETAQTHQAEIARIVGKIAHSFRDPHVAEAIAVAVLAEVTERRRIEINLDRKDGERMLAEAGNIVRRSYGQSVSRTSMRPSQAALAEREQKNFMLSRAAKSA